MKQSFLTVKLYDLERQFGKLQTGIRICQKQNPEEIQKEIDKIQVECREEDMILKQSVENARLEAISALADAQRTYDESVEKILQKIVPESLRGKSPYREEKADMDMIYAEYCIDFAIRASRNALCAALSAVESEMEFEEWRSEHE